MPADKLATYRKKRDFEVTGEPDGTAAPEADAKPRFVIQEHHATALHWDFRLERDGVLVSWAVPKGIPVDPKKDHLAVQTEDHPLAYLDFAGHIPEKEYGGGDVIPWDRGTYDLIKWWDNEVQFVLHGERVRGKYVLFKTDAKNWMIHRMDPPEDPTREPMPTSIEPMLAKLSILPVNDAGWAFEIKWDGVRAIASIDGGRVRLASRNQNETTKQFPELHLLGESLGAREVVLDGEIVALTEAGTPSFERLQNRLGLTRPADIRRRMGEYPVVYMLFDILYLDGHSTMRLPYTERRHLLEGLALDGPSWRTPGYHAGDGAALLEASRAQGLEGVMAKRLDSLYEPGRRSGAWLKVKNSLSQEFVIGGWTPGAGAREDTLGALLLGYYELSTNTGDPPRLRFAGKVGTGFTDRLLRDLLPRLIRARRETSPFEVGTPEPGSIFVEPELVAEVDFLEWTEARTLRHPSFKGFRTDKRAADVTLETTPPASVDAPPLVGRAGPGSRRAIRERVAEPAATPHPGTSGPRAVVGPGVSVVVEGRTLALSNLDKPLYPSGFTKARVIDYYTRIAPVMVPQVAGRPMTLKRYPNGSGAPFFFEKECPKHHPAWVRTASIYSHSSGRDINYCLVDDLPTLVWLANLAALELHPSLSLASQIDTPSSVVFDLDPGPPANVVDCADVALMLRELFTSLGLEAFAKTSGNKGMQIYVPLNTPATYDETKAFSNAVARLLERQHPKKVLSSMNKAQRTGKVFVDWSQNDEHKTTIAVYSLRAREVPSVSTPVTWDEVAKAAATRDATTLHFEAPDVLRRVETIGDIFAPMLTLKQAVPSL